MVTVVVVVDDEKSGLVSTMCELEIIGLVYSLLFSEQQRPVTKIASTLVYERRPYIGFIQKHWKRKKGLCQERG